MYNCKDQNILNQMKSYFKEPDDEDLDFPNFPTSDPSPDTTEIEIDI